MSRKILNFKKDQEYRINSVNVIDGMLFFTDNNSEPKRIELDTFRKADHSSGTTVVFGREFKERDITVIRPQPLDNLNIGIFNPITNDDTPDTSDGDGVPDSTATEPSVVTLNNTIVRTTTAEIFGSVDPNGATIVTKGFYYIKQDTEPTQDEIRNNGTPVTATTSNQFSATITIAQGSRYWFVAYAYNGFNDVVMAPNIETFYVTADSAVITDPTIDTLEPVELSNGTFRLEGIITNDGNGGVESSGFYVEFFEPFNSPTKPTNIYNRSGVTVSPTQRIDLGSAGKHYVDNLNSFGKNFWVQFYIERQSDGKLFYGDVEEFKDVYAPNHPKITVVKADIIQMDEPVIGSIPQTLDIRVVSGIVNIDTNATLDEAGVYFYSGGYDENFQNIRNRHENNAAGSRGVVKIKWDGLSTDTWRDEFVIQAPNATLEAEYDVEYGKYNYFYSYLKQTLPNGQVLWAYKAGFAKLEKPEAYGPPSVVTHDFYSSQEGKLSCWAKVSGGSGDLEAMGFYIYQQTTENFGASDLQSEAAKQRMLDLYNQGKATRFVFKDSNGQNTLVKGAPVVSFPSFSGSQNVTIEQGGTYFGMAFAGTSDGFEGRGGILRYKIAHPADIALSMLSVQEVGNDGEGDYTGSGQIFRFKIVGPRNEDWDDLTQVGFKFAEEEQNDFDFDAASNTTVKYNTSGITVATGKTVTKHQNYLQLASSSVTEDGTIELFAPNSTYFSGGYGERWSVQGFIEFTDGTVIKTTFDNGTQTDGRPGVMEFEPKDPQPHNYAVPVVQVNLDTVQSGAVSNAKYDNLFFLLRIPQVSVDNPEGDVIRAKKLYIIKEDFLTDATDVKEIVDKVDDNSLGISYPGYGVSLKVNGGTPGSYQDFINDIAIELEPDTTYRIVGAAKNNSTNYDTNVTGADDLTNGAGWGYSTSRSFTTMPQRKEVWWDNDNNPGNTIIKHNFVQFVCRFVDDLPSKPLPTRTSMNLYIVKASAIGSNPNHATIVADSDTVSYDMFTENSDNEGAYVRTNRTSSPAFWKITGLDDDTEYWVTLKATMVGIANEGGTVIHKPFKIRTAPPPRIERQLYIKDGDFLTFNLQLPFDSRGGRKENGLQERLAEAYTGTVPTDGYYVRIGMDPSDMELRGYFSSSNYNNPGSEFTFRFFKNHYDGHVINIKYVPRAGSGENVKRVNLRVLPVDSSTPIIDFLLTGDTFNSVAGEGYNTDPQAPTGPAVGTGQGNSIGNTNNPSNVSGTNTIKSGSTGGGLTPPNVPTDTPEDPFLSTDPGHDFI